MKKQKLKSLAELKQIFTGNETNSVLALNLIDKATFMDNTLKNLEAIVKAEGEITLMDQGRYSIERANPALTSYKDLIKSYTTVIKQINDMIPKEKTVEGENLLNFLASDER